MKRTGGAHLHLTSTFNKTLYYEKGSLSPPGPQVIRLDAEQHALGLKLSHRKDFIPIYGRAGAVKLLRTN
jgi:hypothetical protein